MIKHVGPKMSKAIWQLVRLCCIYQDIPKGWREATVYPIPKPMDWESNLNKTRPITLLETIRKALVRLINSRLSKVMVYHSILRGGNHAGLPGGSTLEPLRIDNAILEDARASKKELWILFQDMSKAYDRVNVHMLDMVMQRIQFPVALRSILVNLFNQHKNRIITATGLTDPYDVLIGIDQGEVISPLLWCIYYDPLLVEVQSRQLGYNLSHTYRQNP